MNQYGPNKYPVEWDLERIVDDFIFISMFVGNDFLPLVPTIDITKVLTLLIIM